ncbi:MAG: 16S rRNA (adenine(1518)-N(6)/adenine(1519)-N(6))-dimethyltransferase RsmA [Candidatus Omnitrophica bacterium]|nr:16S rRNA (adenine(1518)-N(6)/adenine(1519)-N(6))-dimethyltransferase RsmA [Candidatus Omnitrophota bacterium]
MHKPKKSLGQNFLIDQNIRLKIINSLDLKPDDIVLEVGSGRGELTGLIAAKIKQVYGIEIDKRLYDLLTQTLSERKNIQIINQDILKFDLAGFIKENKIKSRIKVFGNIPYYISSPIIERLLNFRKSLSAIFITVQKEFAKRVVSLPGNKDYGSFSCFVQYYTLPRIIFEISKNCFKPAPKVDSAFLELKIREFPAVLVKDEGLLFSIIRGAFNQRRKTLKNSLLELVSPEVLDIFFKQSSLNPKTRPECLTLENFALLANTQYLLKNT